MDTIIQLYHFTIRHYDDNGKQVSSPFCYWTLSDDRLGHQLASKWDISDVFKLHLEVSYRYSLEQEKATFLE